MEEMMVRAEFDGKLANMAARKQAAQPTTS
jgi:hypothetical protein